MSSKRNPDAPVRAGVPQVPDEPEPRRPGFFRRLFRTLVLVAVLFVVAIGGWAMYVQVQRTNAQPWQWSGDQWADWFERSLRLGGDVSSDVVQKSREAKDRAVELGSQAVESVKSVEWSKIGNRISAKTQELFGRSEDVAKQIDEQKKQVKEDSGEYAPKFTGPAGEQYDYGLQWLEKGLAEWRVSVKESENEQVLNARATERAKRFFERAVSSFEEAKRLDPALPNLESFLQQAREYHADSVERQKKIEEVLAAQQQQEAAAPPAAASMPGAAAPVEPTAAATSP